MKTKFKEKKLGGICKILCYIIFTNFNTANKTSGTSYNTPFILIDAGHGYPDGGAVGLKTNVKEHGSPYNICLSS